MSQVDILLGKRTNVKKIRIRTNRKITADEIISILKFINSSYILLKVILLYEISFWIKLNFV